MSNVERTTSWQQIQQGVKEAERLIARKEYNLVMVRARQVLEYMVRCMAERACVVEGDLSDTIDQLYEGQWINKATKDNYHTIRILGNKAVHEGDLQEVRGAVRPGRPRLQGIHQAVRLPGRVRAGAEALPAETARGYLPGIPAAARPARAVPGRSAGAYRRQHTY